MRRGSSVPKIRRLHPSCVGLLPACGVPGIWDRAGRAEPWAGSRRDAELSCRKSFCCLMQAPNYLGCDLSRAVPGKNARRAAVPTPPGWEWRAQPAWPLGENMFGFVLSGAVLPRHLESTPLRLGGWVPGEQLWVFFSEDRLQLRFWGSCAVPCHLRVSVDEMGTAPCSEAGAVPRVLAASEPLPITLKKIPQGFFCQPWGAGGTRHILTGTVPRISGGAGAPVLIISAHSPTTALAWGCLGCAGPGGGSETSPGQGARRV